MKRQRQDNLLFKYLILTFNNIPEGKEKSGKDLRFAILAAMLLLTSLLLTGSEAVKVILRKKIGLNEISYIRFFLTVILFTIFGLLLVSSNEEYALRTSFAGSYYNATSYIATGVFYILLAVLLVILGIDNKLKAQKMDDQKRALPPMYPGESRVWGSAEKMSAKQRSLARNVYDPLLFLAGGLISLFYINPFWGLPLLICAISYWMVFLVEFTAGIEKERLNAIREHENNYNNLPPNSNPPNISSIQNKW